MLRVTQQWAVSYSSTETRACQLMTACRLLTISPASKNSLPEGTQVAGIPNTSAVPDAQVQVYADDLKLYMCMSIAGCAHTFQKCMDNLTLWSRTWQLHISHKNVYITTWYCCKCLWSWLLYWISGSSWHCQRSWCFGRQVSQVRPSLVTGDWSLFAVTHAPLSCVSAEACFTS